MLGSHTATTAGRVVIATGTVAEPGSLDRSPPAPKTSASGGTIHPTGEEELVDLDQRHRMPGEVGHDSEVEEELAPVSGGVLAENHDVTAVAS